MKTIPTPISTQLPDGTPVTLRPLEGADEQRLPQALQHLTGSSAVLRFFVPVSPVQNEESGAAKPALNKPGIAWVAVTPGQDQILGLGRLVRFETKPWLAEIVLGVAPSFQRRGLGRMLLARLHSVAEAEGIRTFYALVQEENQPVIAWCKRLGATAKLYVDQIVELELPVEAALMPQNESSRKFQDCIQPTKNSVKRTSRKGNGGRKRKELIAA